MKLPRDIGGEELANKLTRYGYQVTRQTGRHIRLSNSSKGREHHITIPKHKFLKISTLSSIIKDVAIYLEIDWQYFVEELFK